MHITACSHCSDMIDPGPGFSLSPKMLVLCISLLAVIALTCFPRLSAYPCSLLENTNKFLLKLEPSQARHDYFRCSECLFVIPCCCLVLCVWKVTACCVCFDVWLDRLLWSTGSNTIMSTYVVGIYCNRHLIGQGMSVTATITIDLFKKSVFLR